MYNFKSLRIHLLFVTLFFTAGSYSQNADIDLLKTINPRYPDAKVWKAASASAYALSTGSVVCTFAYGIIEHDKKTVYNGYELLGSLAISAVVSEAFKITINRTRPADKYPGDVFPYEITHGKSFPSGHVTLVFATATTLSLQYKKWYVVVPCFMWATSVAYSRMYLGEHYPSDIAGGVVIGAGSALLSKWLSKKILKQ